MKTWSVSDRLLVMLGVVLVLGLLALAVQDAHAAGPTVVGMHDPGYSAAGTTSQAVNVPYGTVSGDMELAFLSATSSTAVLSCASGFSTYGNRVQGAGISTLVCYRQSDGTDAGTSATFGIATSLVAWHVVLGVWHGPGGIASIQSSGGTGTSTATSVGGTSTAANQTNVIDLLILGAPVGTTTPSGYTLEAGTTTGLTAPVNVYTKDLGAAGSTEAVSIPLSTSATWVVWQIVLQAATPATTTTTGATTTTTPPAPYTGPTASDFSAAIDETHAIGLVLAFFVCVGVGVKLGQS